MSDGMTTALQDKLRLALDKFPHMFCRTTPDPERVPLAVDEFADTVIPETELLFNPIRDVIIGK
jgi:hypothetical protein